MQRTFRQTREQRNTGRSNKIAAPAQYRTLGRHRLRLFRRGFALRGFTLLELMIAIAVIGILAAILLGVFSRSREAAHRAACDVHLKAISLALDAFKQEQGSYPETLQELVDRKYITDPGLLSCPDDPRPAPSYDDFYVIRGPRDNSDLPILICPFHDDTSHGNQAYTGRYTTQFMTSPAVLTAGTAVTVEHPGKNPVAAPVGLELHGADRIRTSSQGNATIQFADGSTAAVNHDADITILQSFITSKANGPLYTLVHQTTGSVIYTIHHGSKFDVVTPTATAGALGTAFEVRVSPTQGTWLNVASGKVRFNTLDGTSSEETPNGYWMASEPPNAAPPPPPPAPHRPPPPPPKPQSGSPPPA